MAGPVSVAAVVLPPRTTLLKSSRVVLGDGRLRDSKHLTPAAREEWFRWLKKQQAVGRLYFSVSLVGEKIVDSKGIVPAVKIGIRRVLYRLQMSPDDCRLRLDGSLKAPAKYLNQQTVIRGDSTVPIIMLASIAAKVRRDRRMMRLARRYVGYGFEIHKGYGTRKHYATLRRRGLSPLHRRSFLKKLFLR